jgi:hypothetical protein
MLRCILAPLARSLRRRDGTASGDAHVAVFDELARKRTR